MKATGLENQAKIGSKIWLYYNVSDYEKSINLMLS